MVLVILARVLNVVAVAVVVVVVAAVCVMQNDLYV